MSCTVTAPELLKSALVKPANHALRKSKMSCTVTTLELLKSAKHVRTRAGQNPPTSTKLPPAWAALPVASGCPMLVLTSWTPPESWPPPPSMVDQEMLNWAKAQGKMRALPALSRLREYECGRSSQQACQDMVAMRKKVSGTPMMKKPGRWLGSWRTKVALRRQSAAHLCLE